MLSVVVLVLVVQMVVVPVVGICHLLAPVVDYFGLGFGLQSRGESVFVLVQTVVVVVREDVILCVEACFLQPRPLNLCCLPVRHGLVPGFSTAMCWRSEGGYACSRGPSGRDFVR